MKKVFLVLMAVVLVQLNLSAQKKLQIAIGRLYQENKSLFKGNIYLCDTVFYERSFNYEYAKNYLINSDLKSAKIIIANGEIVKFNPIELGLLSAFKLKSISFSDFENLQSPMVKIKESEKESMRILDSLNSLSQKINDSNFKNEMGIYQQIDSLHNNRSIKNYKYRVNMTTKRLMILHQTYQFKNKFLFFFTIYKDFTNSMNYVVICHQ